ncbi:S-4TM family putative pore-forming effector [Streptomyces sp. NPDC057474]|uniref:S-4TM family putative pore-forming effector n=1 Tax=Streptomyces sp. NPDC057474 TaxID=3346144 RepID=UPI00367C567B
MGAPASDPIVVRQNAPEMITLLCAMSASHARATRLGSSHVAVSVLLAGAALVSVFVSAAGTPVTLLGSLWAAVYAIGSASWTEREFRRAALLQETFDVRLFGLPWNEVVGGRMPTAQEISRMARRYRGSEDALRDYYEIRDFPVPVDVLACQLQNLGWGARIRRRYGLTVLSGLVLWCLAGLLLGVLGELTVSEVLLRWFVPSLGLLLLGLDTYRSQQDVITKREQALTLLTDRLRDFVRRGSPAAGQPELLTLSRQVQDVLLQTRMRHARVPNWFFRRFLTTDRADFSAAMNELEQLLATAPDPVP